MASPRPVRQSEDITIDGVRLRLVRSRARRRTVQAQWRDSRLQISLPAGMPPAEERQWISRMMARAGAAPQVRSSQEAGSSAGNDGARPAGTAGMPAPRAQQPGRQPQAADAALYERAERLRHRLLPQAPAPVAVTWSTRQRRRWGSCTPTARTIRISTMLQGMPEWVVDAVVLHELAHLLEPGHGPRFQELVHGTPRYLEAMAFLQGVDYATGRGLTAGSKDGIDGCAH